MPPGLPIRDPGEGITIGHLDLRQTLGVEHLALRDDVVEIQQIGCQRVDLIGRERPLLIEGNTTIDVVPDPRGVWCANREDPAVVPRVSAQLRFAFDQPGSAAPDPVCSVARRAPSAAIDELAFLRGAPPRRELLARRTDGDIPGTDFLFGRSPSDTIRRRLCRGRAPEEHHQQQKF